jgi:hypothetical protein
MLMTDKRGKIVRQFHARKTIIKKTLYIFSSCVLSGILLIIAFYFISIHNINKEYYERYSAESRVALRKFPYPYRAAIAISSDIDNTETVEEFLELQKFLNTSKTTSMGEGIGLEIGNSFLFYEPQIGSISYFNSSPEVAETILEHIKTRQIDVMHSFGKKDNFTRQDAIKALNELKRNDIKMDVWVDHEKSKSNLGDDVTFGLGDHPDSEAYHADLTLNHGIRFVWLGRVTMITGQAVPVTLKRFTGLFDKDHPIHSFVNICKEFVKNAMGVLGSKKYAMHRSNDLVRIAKLDDGNKVYEFTRFDNFWKGVATGATNKRLAYVISEKTLNRLKETGGYMIVYTHWGKNSDCPKYICKETQDALRNLAEEYRAGNIYVTTTSKLLNYYINHKYLDWSYESKADGTKIIINSVKDPVSGAFTPTLKDLEGTTFYVQGNKSVRMFVGVQEIEGIRRNPPDNTGRPSVSIQHIHLKFPDHPS